MGRGRPKRITADMALRRGNPGYRIVRTLRAAAEMAGPEEVDPIEAPEHLPPEVREIWRVYSSTPVGQSILRTSDRFALERLCTYVFEWAVLTRSLSDARGRLRLVERGMLAGYGMVAKIGAYVRMRAQIEASIRSLETAFGFTPASRASVLERLCNVLHDPSAPRRAFRETENMDDKGRQPMPSSPIGVIGGPPRGKPN